MWFEKLTDFTEKSPEQVRENLEITGDKLISKVNGKVFLYGKLEIPSLEELREQIDLSRKYDSKIKVAEIVGDIQQFHQEKSNNGALIQVASQFNLLEMASPNRIPEDGVGIYEYDHTQGPACAIACGAGTIYRNYFVPVNGQIGQTASRQIDCLKDLGTALGNEKNRYWRMVNGYALATREGLKAISQHIQSLSEKGYEDLKGKLRIGIQQNTEVALNNNGNKVTQAYCSALPVAYSDIESTLWTDFAQLIMEGTYEATFFAALKNYERTGNNKVFLTLVGGGAFGNKEEWIFSALAKAVKKFSDTPLDVKIVSYRSSNPRIRLLVEALQKE